MREEERQADTSCHLVFRKSGYRAIWYGGRSSSWRISNSRSAQSATIIAFHDMPNQWDTCPASRKACIHGASGRCRSSLLHSGPLHLLAASLRFAPSSGLPFRIMHPSLLCVRVRARREVSPISRRGAVMTRLQHQSQRHSCTLGTDYNAAGLTCVAGPARISNPLAASRRTDVVGRGCNAVPISHPEFPDPEFRPLMAAPQSLSLPMQA